MPDEAQGNVAVERRGTVLSVAIDRPEKRNAFDDRTIAELTDVFREAADDADLRCLVLSGHGKAFCAGADLNWMKAAAGYGSEENVADAQRLADMLITLDAVPAVTIARVHGAALGGAQGLVAACDVALAASGTKFGFTEVRLGIVPAVISPVVLRKIPPGAARRYFQTGELFDAETACRIGLVSEVVPEDDLDAAVERVVRSVLAAGPAAVREARRLVDTVAGRPLDAAFAETVRWIARLRATPEAKEGMSAFLEKRAPAWKGEMP